MHELSTELKCMHAGICLMISIWCTLQLEWAVQTTGTAVSGPTYPDETAVFSMLLNPVCFVVVVVAQVLGTIRHISLRALPEMSAQALAWADLSSFTSFVALDCLLPGPQEWHAFIKLFARTIALPILLLLASALMWTICWLFRHFAARMHRKYGYRHTLRWQPLRQMQRQVTSVPDPFKAYLSPRMLITVVVLSYSLYPLVTSGLLYTLQCVYIPGPFAVESAAVEYSRRHYDWLLQRAAAANSTSSNGSTAAAAAAASDMGARDIQLCSPGSGPLQSGLCWVTGRFWAMDYDVQVSYIPLDKLPTKLVSSTAALLPWLFQLWLFCICTHPPAAAKHIPRQPCGGGACSSCHTSCRCFSCSSPQDATLARLSAPVPR